MVNGIVAPLGQFTGNGVSTKVTRTANFSTSSSTLTLTGTGPSPTEGMFVTGTGIAAGTTVTVVNGNTVTISQNTTAAGTGASLKFSFDAARTATFATSSPTLTLTGTGTSPSVGMFVTGTGMAAGAYVTAVNGNIVTITPNTTAASAASPGNSLVFSDDLTRTATFPTTSPTLTLTGTGGVPTPGMFVTGTSIPAGAYVVAVSGSILTLSVNSTAASAASPGNTLTFLSPFMTQLSYDRLLKMQVATLTVKTPANADAVVIDQNGLTVGGSSISVASGLSVGGVPYAPMSALSGYAALSSSDTITVPSSTSGTVLTLTSQTSGESRFPSKLTVEQDLTVSSLGNAMLNGTANTMPNQTLGSPVVGSRILNVNLADARYLTLANGGAQIGYGGGYLTFSSAISLNGTKMAGNSTNALVVGIDSGNSATGAGAVSIGGNNNIATGSTAVVLGGFNPFAGQQNVASGQGSMILGAKAATVESTTSIIAGGQGNQILGSNTQQSFILGGQGNTMTSNAGGNNTIIVGGNNQIVSGAFFSALIAGTYNQITDGDYNQIILGGSNASMGRAASSAIIGGNKNQIVSRVPNDWWEGEVTRGSVIAGGYSNVIQTTSQLAVIVGGGGNSVGAWGSFVSGSWGASVTGSYSAAVATNNAIVSGDMAFAQGSGTKALGNCQVVVGKFNVGDANKAFIVGNGSSDTARSNAMTMDWNGNVVFSGTVSDSSGVILSNGNVTMPGCIQACNAIFTSDIHTDGNLTASGSASEMANQTILSGSTVVNSRVLTVGLADARYTRPSGTFTGTVSTTSNISTTTGNITTTSGNINAVNAILSGAVTSSSVTSTGNISGVNASLSGAVTADSATVSGSLQANTVQVQTNLQATKAEFTGRVRLAPKGGISMGEFMYDPDAPP